MKPRRKAGATHSFRLSRRAADIVDDHPPFVSLEGKSYPRTLGGKSALVSECICYYYGGDSNDESVHDLRERVQFWMTRAEALQQGQISAPPMGGRSSIFTRIARWIQRLGQ
jgi:hypothetical protein